MPSVDAAAAEQQRIDPTGTGSASRNKLAKDLNTFLTLLTTQLKNQDPLSPMDSTEFTNQLVQFAQVEQQIAQNEKLENMISLSLGSQQAMAVQFMGHTIEAQSDQLPLQNGKAKFAYGVAEDAKSVGIMINNADGETVFTAAGEPLAGMHSFEWDGTDNDGNALEDGTYTITVTALDQDGSTIETWTTVFGTVDGVTNKDGETMLIMDKVGVPMSKVLSITAPGVEPTPSQTSPPGDTTGDTTTDTGGDTATDEQQQS